MQRRVGQHHAELAQAWSHLVHRARSRRRPGALEQHDRPRGRVEELALSGRDDAEPPGLRQVSHHDGQRLGLAALAAAKLADRRRRSSRRTPGGSRRGPSSRGSRPRGARSPPAAIGAHGKPPTIGVHDHELRPHSRDTPSARRESVDCPDRDTRRGTPRTSRRSPSTCARGRTGSPSMMVKRGPQPVQLRNG